MFVLSCILNILPYKIKLKPTSSACSDRGSSNRLFTKPSITPNHKAPSPQSETRWFNTEIDSNDLRLFEKQSNLKSTTDKLSPPKRNSIKYIN